jgi:hypothetical protein
MGGLDRMQNHLVRKGLVVGIITILILVCIPQNVCAEELPDLIIENIVIDEYGHHVPPGQEFYCRITNSGDKEVTAYIVISVHVVRCLFGIFPVFLEREYTGSIINEEGLSPGTSVDIQFAYKYELPEPLFGIFLFKAEVDPDNMIAESNDSNNHFTDKFQIFFSMWDYI